MATVMPELGELLSFLEGLTFGGESRLVRVIDREQLLDGTHPKEVLTCQLSDGRVQRLLCKYGQQIEAHHAFGHRSGVALEGKVYEEVLEPFGIRAPRRLRFNGVDQRFKSWLALEYLEGSLVISTAIDTSPLELAARVAARLHNVTASRLSDSLASSVMIYDRDYFQGWVQRGLEYVQAAAPNVIAPDWLGALSDRAVDWIDRLLLVPNVLIHGEYYPKNILSWHDQAYVVDWESAALGPGEVDLASLIEGWDEASALRCLDVYRTTRWPAGAPAAHGEALVAAQIYLQFRWLGDRKDWITPGVLAIRLPRLEASARALGLI